MNIRTASLLTALLFLAAPLAIVTPATAQDPAVPSFPAAPSLAAMQSIVLAPDNGFTDGGFEAAFGTPSDRGGYLVYQNDANFLWERAAPSQEQASDGDQSVKMLAVPAVNDDDNADYAARGVAGAVAVPGLKLTDVVGFQYDILHTDSSIGTVRTNHYVSFDIDGDGVAGGCFSSVQQTVQAVPAWQTLTASETYDVNKWKNCGGDSDEYASVPASWGSGSEPTAIPRTLEQIQTDLPAGTLVKSGSIQVFQPSHQGATASPVYVDNYILQPQAQAAAAIDCIAGDPVFEALCTAASAAGATASGSDLDADGRPDTASLKVGDVSVHVQLDFFYSPPSENSNADYTALTGDAPFDVPVDVMLYNPAGAFVTRTGTGGGYDEFQFYATNHYGVPRDQIGSLIGYIGIYDRNAAQADGYGSCWACVQPDTNRIAVRSGPGTFEQYNGAPGYVGMLQANALATRNPATNVNFLDTIPGASFDFDTISPVDSTEVENSILERRDGMGNYYDNTPTAILVHQRIVDQQFTGDTSLDFPDGEPVGMRFFHVKWPGDRGQPADFFGLYTKYSNLDDDPSTDQQELLCAGQPTNPVNPNAYCADWDGDGILNVDDANPASPDVTLEISWASGDADSNGDYDSSVEAPFLPLLDFDCQGSTKDIILEISKDRGATWNNWEGEPDGNAMDAVCDDSLGNDRPLTTDDRGTVEWQLRVRALNARDSPFVSNVLTVTILGNSAPVGTSAIACVDTRTPSPCIDTRPDASSHPHPSARYQWSWTPDEAFGPGGIGLNDPGQVISSITVRDWVDRNGNTAGLGDPPAMARNTATGVWSVEETYPVNTVNSAVLTVTDSGGGKTQYTVHLAVNVNAVPAAPLVEVYGPTEDSGETGTLVTVFNYVLDSNSGYEHDADLYYAIQGEGDSAPATDSAFTPLQMAESFCDVPVSSGFNAMLEEVLVCNGVVVDLREECLLTGESVIVAPRYQWDNVCLYPTVWVGEIDVPAGATLHYFFRVTDTDGGLAIVKDEGDYFTLEIPAEEPPEELGIPDPLDYVIGDCNLLADVIAMSQDARAPNCENMDTSQFDPVLEGIIPPTDQLDFRNVDGDASNDGEPNGQIDYVEMYIASYDFREDDRPSVRIYRPTGVTPANHDEVRLTFGDHPGTDQDELLLVVIDGQNTRATVPLTTIRVPPTGNVVADNVDYYYCAYVTADGSALNVGEGLSEAEACSEDDVSAGGIPEGTVPGLETDNGVRVLDGQGNVLLGITTVGDNPYDSRLHFGPLGEDSLGAFLGLEQDPETGFWGLGSPAGPVDAPGQGAPTPDPAVLLPALLCSVGVDEFCPAEEPVDSDGDGVPDDEDRCPGLDDNDPEACPPEPVDPCDDPTAEGCLLDPGQVPSDPCAEGSPLVGTVLCGGPAPDPAMVLDALCAEGSPLAGGPACGGSTPDPFLVIEGLLTQVCSTPELSDSPACGGPTPDPAQIVGDLFTQVCALPGVADSPACGGPVDPEAVFEALCATPGMSDTPLCGGPTPDPMQLLADLQEQACADGSPLATTPACGGALPDPAAIVGGLFEEICATPELADSPACGGPVDPAAVLAALCAMPGLSDSPLCGAPVPDPMDLLPPEVQECAADPEGCVPPVEPDACAGGSGVGGLGLVSVCPRDEGLGALSFLGIDLGIKVSVLGISIIYV